jgi:hypothetical protein
VKPEPRIRLEHLEHLWIKQKWEIIRKSQTAADQADRDWNDLNDALNTKLDAEGVTDIVQRDRTKGASLALKSSLDTGKWHAGNAQRHIDDVSLFVKLRELEIL